MAKSDIALHDITCLVCGLIVQGIISERIFEKTVHDGSKDIPELLDPDRVCARTTFPRPVLRCTRISPWRFECIRQLEQK